MVWNYRIVQYADNSGFGLHEVYYDSDGDPTGMTQKPVRFECDVDEGPEGIRGSLAKAVTDALMRPIFTPPDHWRS